MDKKYSVIKRIIFIVSIFTIGMFFKSEKVYANSYDLTCPMLEVSKIENDGTFSKVECYDLNNIGAARNKMRENDDYVLRSIKSLSPTHIIDMNSGLVYSYPARKKSATITLHQSITSSYAGSGVTTYTDSYRPMVYYSNGYYDERGVDGSSRGWVKVSCHGFEGYTDLEAVEFVPYKFIEKGIPITIGGNQSYNSEKSYSVICKANTYEAVKNGNYTDLVFTTYLGYVSSGNTAKSYSYKIGVAPSFMVPGTKYYSNDGVNFYSDIRLKNFVGTYYNYYQFLPFRTKTKISAGTLDSFVSSHSGSVMINKGNEFKNNEGTYGCNAALIYAIAIHESSWGTSGYAKNRNNLFGLNAFDSDPNKAFYFDSVNDCIAFIMGDFLANYMDYSCGNYFSMSLGNKGGGFITKYASDMYWAEKISQYYYDLDKFANNYNGNLTDYNSYNISLVNTYNVAVKKDASNNSATLYNVANKNGYQQNLIVVNLGGDNNFTKIQTSNPIDDQGNVVKPITLQAGTKVTYNFDKSVGYVPTSSLTPLNYSNTPVTPQPKEPVPDKMEPMVAIETLTLEGNKITIKGIGAITYTNFDDLSKIKHEFVIKNLETGNEATFDLTSEEYTGFGLNDGYNYKYVGFSGIVDLTEVIEGSFKLMIRITNGEFIKDKEICNNGFKYYNMMSKAGDVTNKISSNSRYNYRLELEITNTPLDYSKVNIVDNRPSLFSFDNFTIDEDLNIHIDGQAFIYYTNYDVAENVNYKVYLIKDGTDYKELNTTRKTCSIDFNNVINSSYDLTNICFETNDNLSDLGDGKYKMIIEIDKVDGTKTYIDYVEMKNLGNLPMPNTQKDNKIFEVIKSEIRERMELEVKTNEEEN